MFLFNQVLAVGFIATLFQVVFVWPFIQAQGLLFLVMNLGILGAFWLNHKGLSWHSKRLFQLITYLVGAYTTLILGGSGYYHFQAFLIFYLGLIMFNWKKEKFEILIGIPFIGFSIFTGELGWFGAPDFSDHELIHVVRFANLSSLFMFTTIFTFFLIRTSRQNEAKLADSIRVKENLLKEILDQKKELEQGTSRLEAAVERRTEEITQQKETLKQQNAEMELLLKEVHHRVQNNLQIIVSLLNLQRNKFDDEVIDEALSEVQNRVHSMSLVHKRMYQTSDFVRIELKDYVEQILQNIGELYSSYAYITKNNIQDAIKIDVEKAIPLGLIINEIATNFFKHSYSDQSKQFEMSAIIDKSNQILLTYKDNGKGFETLPDSDISQSLGLQLIDSLVQQIDGELNVYNDNGAVYEIRFKTDA